MGNLLLEKYSIYYSDLEYGGEAYKTIPNFVVTNQNELISLFDKIVKSNLKGGIPSKKDLINFDAYFDDKSRHRIINYLSCNNTN